MRAEAGARPGRRGGDGAFPALARQLDRALANLDRERGKTAALEERARRRDVEHAQAAAKQRAEMSHTKIRRDRVAARQQRDVERARQAARAARQRVADLEDENADLAILARTAQQRGGLGRISSAAASAAVPGAKIGSSVVSADTSAQGSVSHGGSTRLLATATPPPASAAAVLRSGGSKEEGGSEGSAGSFSSSSSDYELWRNRRSGSKPSEAFLHARQEMEKATEQFSGDRH